MRKIIASSTLAAMALGGGIVASQQIAGAQDGPVPTTEESVTPGWIEDALAGLVSDGTLTEDQVEAVGEALREARPERGPHGPRHGARAEVLEALGLDAETVREGRLAGQTLAEIAEAHGLTRAEVVDAIAAQLAERIDAAVAEGRIDEERAEEARAGVAERAERIADGETRARTGRGMRGHHRDLPGLFDVTEMPAG